MDIVEHVFFMQVNSLPGADQHLVEVWQDGATLQLGEACKMRPHPPTMMIDGRLIFKTISLNKVKVLVNRDEMKG